jgi:hypothetical protein
MRTLKLTCETEGCENSNIGILLATDATSAICGACNTEITNIVVVEELPDAGATEAE